MKQNLIVIIVMVIFGFSCNNSGNTQKTNEVSTNESNYNLPDLEGNYILPSGGCDLSLAIVKGNNDFEYFFKGMGGIIDMTGKLIFSLEEDSSYTLTFDGPIENNPPKTVEAMYKDNIITIQNYGNAQQNFMIFSDCEEKYLEFTKK